jgi:hypothetical protein
MAKRLGSPKGSSAKASAERPQSVEEGPGPGPLRPDLPPFGAGYPNKIGTNGRRKVCNGTPFSSCFCFLLLPFHGPPPFSACI